MLWERRYYISNCDIGACVLHPGTVEVARTFEKGSEKSTMTYLLNAGYDIRTVQELFGHKDVKTTMIYTHMLKRGPAGVRSPVDGL